MVSIPGFASGGNAAICCGSVCTEVDDFAGTADCVVGFAGAAVVAADAVLVVVDGDVVADVCAAAANDPRIRTAENFHAVNETHFIRSWMRFRKTILFRPANNVVSRVDPVRPKIGIESIR